jgi:hypothetical protein
MNYNSVNQPKPLQGEAGVPSVRASTFVIAGFFLKFAKHLALLACLLIVGGATGRTNIGPVGVFFLILGAAAIYSAGRTLELKSMALNRLLRVRR